MVSDNIKQFIDKVEPVYSVSKGNLGSFVHIVGTNGKGSTLYFLSKILNAHGFTVNCFSSPHLLSENERIKINLQNISNKLLKELDSLIYSNLKKNSLTYFEDMFLKALLVFKKHKSDFTLIEAGIGAKHDITNALPNKSLTIITSVSFDHQNILGADISQIISEKCAAMQKDTPCVVAMQKHEVYEEIHNFGLKKQAKVFTYNKDFVIDASVPCIKIGDSCYKVPNSFLDSYQIQNIATALFAAHLLLKGNLNAETLFKVLKNSLVFEGRVQELKAISNNASLKEARFILDCAHNEDGFKELAVFLKQNFAGYKIHFVLSLQKTKNLQSFFKTFKSILGNVYYVPIDGSFYSASDVVLQGKNHKVNVITCSDFKELESSLKLKKEDKNLIVFTGSFYLLAHLVKSGFKYN